MLGGKRSKPSSFLFNRAIRFQNGVQKLLNPFSNGRGYLSRTSVIGFRDQDTNRYIKPQFKILAVLIFVEKIPSDSKSDVQSRYTTGQW